MIKATNTTTAAVSTSHALDAQDTKALTRLFYGGIGVVASLALALVFYWGLRLNSSISSIIQNTVGVPLYFWPYVFLTAGAIILFGVNTALFTYRWRKYGPPRLRPSLVRATAGRQVFGGQVSAGIGSLVGVTASACPVCGSVILSAIGITAGLAAFPLQGLELKALSFGLLALPIWLVRRDLKRLESDCLPAEASAQAGASSVCPAPRDHSFKESDRPWLLGLLALIVLLAVVGWNMAKDDPAVSRLSAVRGARILNPNDNRLQGASTAAATTNPLVDKVMKKVLPEQGFQSTIRLGESVVRLVEHGVIDPEKFTALYQDRGGLPAELEHVLTQPSDAPMLLTRENAHHYVNLLWPLGLANTMSTNKDSPIAGDSLFNFASTGGWNLGREENGGSYFNKFPIVPLAPEQEALVTKISQSTYRPCCNNSTFFQDCNHGSALLGLLQLGVSQGLTEYELYREALAFNAFWFPHNYLQTALYFKVVKNTDWEDVDPKIALGEGYSSVSGWSGTVSKAVQRAGLLPQTQGGAGCGV